MAAKVKEARTGGPGPAAGSVAPLWQLWLLVLPSMLCKLWPYLETLFVAFILSKRG